MTPRLLNRERVPPKILHIEDNEENRMLVRALLEAAGYTVIDAEDGLSGIEAAVREEPALILLDINLPGVDGYEVGVLLKSFPKLTRTPIIAVTAYAMEGDRQRTLVAGCDGYIQKPIDVDAFPSQVAEFLEGKRERVESREEGTYLRELNQRLVYRLVSQVEDLKGLNEHVVRRAGQLEALHESVRDITSELGVVPLLERLLPALARALGVSRLTVELFDPAGVRVTAEGPSGERPHKVLESAGFEEASAPATEWKLPLAVQGRDLGLLTATAPNWPGGTADEEQLLKIVANQIAIAVENTRLYRDMQRRAAEEQSLTEAGRLLAGTLELPEVLAHLADLARTRLEADVVRIWLRDGEQLRLSASSGAVRTQGIVEIAFKPGEGTVGWIVENRAPLVLEDLASDRRVQHRDFTHDESFVSFMGVPLLLEGEGVGALVVGSRERRAFSTQEVALAEALATSTAVAIRNARLFAAQREEAEVSAALLKLAQAVEAVRDLDQVLETVVRTTPQLLGATQSMLLLYEPDDRTFVPVVASGLTPEQTSGFEALRGAATMAAIARAEQAREPVIAEASRPDFGIPREFAGVLDVRSMLIMPLVSGGRLMGVMLVQTPGQLRAFTAKEMGLARGIAAHAALAIDKARLFQQTQARLQETATLLAVSRAVSATLDPIETMRRVAREISRALGADMVGAYLADAEGAMLHPIAGYHVPKTMIEQFTKYPIPIKDEPGMESAWKERKAVWTSDAGASSRVERATYERFPHRSLLFAPMIVKGEPIGGFFLVWWQERRQFTPDEIRLIEGIAEQAAIFMENARLYSEATRRRREAEELARVARMLTESLDVTDVGERIVTSARLLLGGTFSVLRLLQPDGSLKLIASKGDAQELASLEPVLPAGTGVMGRALTTGQAAWSADVLTDSSLDLPDNLRGYLVASGSRAYLAAPLRVKREIIGVIGIGDAAARRFSEGEVALLQIFADQAAIAFENSRLYGELREALVAVEESQHRIVQGERLRALGEMAGGVAHDFNNVLAIIVGRAEVLLNETEDVDLQRQLNVIIKVALDAAQTVKRIQEFTRMRRARPFQQVNLGQLVAEMVEVTRSRWKDEAQAKGITYEVVVDAGPTPAIAGDPSEIREALTNILFNAFDAMPSGGRVELRTGVDGERVFCSVTDAGVGMTEDIKQRIFDPFFTTKGERGTGLGLSVVYGIVTRHGGELDVQSSPGEGSTFTIRLPSGGQTVAEAAPRGAPQTPVKARVLVIDDEREVGDVLLDILSRDGHTVVVCLDGESGVARFEQEPFDLVLTDLGMPGVSGWEVARLCKIARPRTPVAMITGWGDRIDPTDAQGRGVDFVVSKPFKRDDIRELMAAALGRPSAPSQASGATRG